MKALNLILTVFLFFAGCFTLNASHISSGALQYDYVGPGSVPGTHKYRVRAEIFRDCAGANFTNNNVVLTATAGSSVTTYTLNRVVYVAKPGMRPANFGNRDITDLCSAKSSRCASTSNVSGVESHMFEGEITVGSAQLLTLTFTTPCCRAGSINTTSNTGTYTATLHKNKFPKNSSPRLYDWALPKKVIYTGQNFSYAIGAYDPDGDKLTYEMACIGTPKSPYTCQQPILGLKLDTATGIMSFNTTVSGNFLAGVWIKEYDECGELKGQVLREIEFSSYIGTNSVPELITSQMNLSNGTSKSNFKVETCNGNLITFSDSIVDANASDSVRVYCDVADRLPGAHYSVSHPSSNIALVTYTIPAVSIIGKTGNRFFHVRFTDDRCDYPGTNYAVHEVAILPGAKITGNPKACKGSGVQLKAVGGVHYTWTSLSGDPLLVGSNFFPDTLNQDTAGSIKFKPTQNTLLQVKIDRLSTCDSLSPICSVYDTILVQPEDSFSLSTSPNQVLCNTQSGSLSAIPSQPALGYSYRWTPADLLNSDTVANPTFSGITTPTTFHVEVYSDSGCHRVDSIQIQPNPLFPIGMKAMASDTLICQSATIDLQVYKGSPQYSCQTNAHCYGNNQTITIGSGNLNNSGSSLNYPVIYASNKISSKTILMYSAADLKNRGMQSGPINSISWRIKKMASANPAFNNFTIRMGCTSASAITGQSFPTGLVEVYSPKSYTPQLGWNDHTLDNPYAWDGQSNLYVEICWENTTGIADDHEMAFDAVNYASSGYYYQLFNWNPKACLMPNYSAGFPIGYLPQTRFGTCQGVRSTRYTYDWHPKIGGGFVGGSTGDSVQVQANLATAQQYYVVISDSLNPACKDTSYLNLHVVSQYNATPDSINPVCFDRAPSQLTAPTPGGVWKGAGITDSIHGVWNPKIAGIGSHWILYSVTGDACANQDSVLAVVKDYPDGRILTDSLCVGSADTIENKLTPFVPGGYMSGLGVDSVFTTNGKVYYIDGSAYHPITYPEDTVWIRHRINDACVTDTTVGVRILPEWNSTYLGVLNQGTPYVVHSFCTAADHADSLAVGGSNGLWSCIEVPSAMVDPQNGVFDPRLLIDGSYTLKVENNGFCGSSNTIPISVVSPPEIAIAGKIWCKDSCNNPAFQLFTDTLKLYVPKGINAGGTGDIQLGVPGNDTLVSYASKQATGWPNAVNDVQFNFWDGGSWMPLPHIGRYRPCNLPVGVKNKISYQFPIAYRSAIPDSLCYSTDSAFVARIDCDTTTSIMEEFGTPWSMRLAPNPAYDHLTISVHPEIKEWKISGYNMLGVQLFYLDSKEYSNHQILIETHELPTGNYMIRMESGGSTRYEKLVIGSK
ncbi:T9SS type A sorting domain-containing protein [bacterium SCSIO 12741]|nr:T9SS type A sorting domain-containing protein [bacterium SCSIO 12741]